MRKKENGAIIVEATLVLPFFMFAIITVLSIVNICFAQAKIGTALNETAREMSEYSYVIGLTGLAKKQQELYEGAGTAYGSIDQIANGVSDIFSSAASIGDTAGSVGYDITQYQNAYNSISSDIQNIQNGGSSIVSGAEALAADPVSILKMAGNEAIEQLKSYFTSKVAPAFMKKNLVRFEGDDPELFLKWLGVVPDGSYIDGLHLRRSVIFLNGSEEIKVIADYEIKVIKLLNIDVKFHFTQCGATKAWFEGDGTHLTSNSDAGGGGAEDGQDPDTEEIEEEETSKSSLRSAEDYAKLSTVNGSSNVVVLGKYDGSSNDYTNQSYIETAIEFEATYFNMDNYDEVKAQTDDDFMWSINEAFLKQQKAQNKDFYLTSNPSTATGSYKKEVDWLKANGYKFELNPGLGVWKAVKE